MVRSATFIAILYRANLSTRFANVPNKARIGLLQYSSNNSKISSDHALARVTFVGPYTVGPIYKMFPSIPSLMNVTFRTKQLGGCDDVLRVIMLDNSHVVLIIMSVELFSTFQHFG